ncbi:MAG TPA: orotate phosphoribosyltransferase [Alphaproteobacteria bacterium]|nr:orotate phosphoribosyltransferase [Alphaproteobacteria bacterium]
MPSFTHRDDLLTTLRQRSVGLKNVRLASGKTSNYYCNVNATLSQGREAMFIANGICEVLENAVKLPDPLYVGGLELAGVPLAQSVAMAFWVNCGRYSASFWVRKKPKDHGTGVWVDGFADNESLQGKQVVIVEDVTTTGESAMKAAMQAQAFGATVVAAITVVDRQEGAIELFRGQKIPFYRLFTAAELLPIGFVPKTVDA